MIVDFSLGREADFTDCGARLGQAYDAIMIVSTGLVLVETGLREDAIAAHRH